MRIQSSSIGERDGGPETAISDLSQLMTSSYPKLRAKASYYFRSERPGHLLEPAAVANEAFIRMKKRSGEVWKDEAQVLRAASLEMRRALVEHARASKALKRWGQMKQVPWNDGLVLPPEKVPELEIILTVRELLARLEELEPQMVAMIQLHYFEGYDIEEIADELKVSKGAVESELSAARAWLRGHLESDANPRTAHAGETKGLKRRTQTVLNGTIKSPGQRERTLRVRSALTDSASRLEPSGGAASATVA